MIYHTFASEHQSKLKKAVFIPNLFDLLGNKSKKVVLKITLYYIWWDNSENSECVIQLTWKIKGTFLINDVYGLQFSLQ